MIEKLNKSNKIIIKLNKEISKYKQYLDEIEEIVSKGVKIHDDIIVNKQILQLVKQAKEGVE